MSDDIRARVLGLATRGELTIQQVDYLLGRVEELSGAEADLLIRAFIAENANGTEPKGEPPPKREGIGDRIKGFTDRFRTMSADDLKRTVNEEYLIYRAEPAVHGGRKGHARHYHHRRCLRGRHDTAHPVR